MANDVKPGSIYRYPYLWRREALRGETEGRKPRPVCLAVALDVADGTYLYFLPITTTAPSAEQTVIEVPALELQRAGLRGEKRGWIVLSEHNRDVLGRSYYFNAADPPIGRFSGRFLAEVIRVALPFLKSAAAKVDRI
jgi:hypothetical protein